MKSDPGWSDHLRESSVPLSDCHRLSVTPSAQTLQRSDSSQSRQQANPPIHTHTHTHHHQLHPQPPHTHTHTQTHTHRARFSMLTQSCDINTREHYFISTCSVPPRCCESNNATSRGCCPQTTHAGNAGTCYSCKDCSFLSGGGKKKTLSLISGTNKLELYCAKHVWEGLLKIYLIQQQLRFLRQ